MIISKINRKYSIGGEIVELVKDKEVKKEVYDKFSAESKALYFTVTEQKKETKKEK